MENSHFKKLALLGLAGSLLISAQSQANQQEEEEKVQDVITGSYLAGKCGGSGGGCGSQKNRGTNPSSNYTADATDDIELQKKNVMPTEPMLPKNGKSDVRYQSSPKQEYAKPVQTNRQLTESELLSQLNADGKAKYQRLDAEGKALALKLASTEQYKDKNAAVKAASDKMAEKRNGSVKK